ncbi:CUB-like domain-containing protein [Caenorhabditis elegans]|uniref:CUB-like domain-containing protein n=1 Tax=Caenorhabditis elegans TaxID=6239 RepID=Q8I4L6_CAEEL|nr:CUB-like domain-containing protein [Caenorhabditis elegans]CAD54131.1 CUB-like domain-containing protein [Caenorhabditis elegans]|eukprot:NP_872187.1 Uncharacterized protein CELE_F10A3.4 [Caenorhabditis elegans]
MLRFSLLFLLGLFSVNAVNFTCPDAAITVQTPTGNLPTGATQLTIVPAGVNCSIQFSIPNGYALLLQFHVDFQADPDKVEIVDSLNVVRYIVHTGTVLANVPLWLAAPSAQVVVTGVSGNSSFLLNYRYQSLSGFKQVIKPTGEHFSLNDLPTNTYYTINASSDTEKVALNYGQFIGDATDYTLLDFFVYDGDNLNTANMIGSLADVDYYMTFSTGKNLSIVNFYGDGSSSYALGNDASTISSFSLYFLYMTRVQTGITGTLAGTTTNGAAYTFICVDCSTFYWTRLQFDSMVNGNVTNVAFQGMTPTHKKEKLLRYDPQTVGDNYFPQIMPTNILTVNLYQARTAFGFNTASTSVAWSQPYDKRKGSIFSSNLWMDNSSGFNYNIRNDSALFNISLNMNSFLLSASDQMNLSVGVQDQNATYSYQYPRDQNINTTVSVNGTYLQVALNSSATSDVRLSFEMTYLNDIIGSTTTLPTTTTTQTPLPTTTILTTRPALTTQSTVFTTQAVTTQQQTTVVKTPTTQTPQNQTTTGSPSQAPTTPVIQTTTKGTENLKLTAAFVVLLISFYI